MAETPSTRVLMLSSTALQPTNQKTDQLHRLEAAQPGEKNANPNLSPTNPPPKSTAFNGHSVSEYFVGFNSSQVSKVAAA
jgi:hypothetical protein